MIYDVVVREKEGVRFKRSEDCLSGGLDVVGFCCSDMVSECVCEMVS